MLRIEKEIGSAHMSSSLNIATERKKRNYEQ